MIQANCYRNEKDIVLTFPVIMIQSHKGRFPDKTDEELAEITGTLCKTAVEKRVLEVLKELAQKLEDEKYEGQSTPEVQDPMGHDDNSDGVQQSG